MSGSSVSPVTGPGPKEGGRGEREGEGMEGGRKGGRVVREGGEGGRVKGGRKEGGGR